MQTSIQNISKIQLKNSEEPVLNRQSLTAAFFMLRGLDWSQYFQSGPLDFRVFMTQLSPSEQFKLSKILGNKVLQLLESDADDQKWVLELLSFSETALLAGELDSAQCVLDYLAHENLPDHMRILVNNKINFHRQNSSAPDQVKAYAKGFLEEALNPMTILTMALAGYAYRTTKLRVLSKAAHQTPHLFNRGLFLNAKAVFLGSGVELGVFSSAHLLSAVNQGQTLDATIVKDQILHIGLNLMVLKSSMGLGLRFFAKENLRSLSLSQKLGVFSSGVLSLTLAQDLSSQVGFSQSKSFEKSLLDSIVLQSQYSLGMALAGHVFQKRYGKEYQRLESETATFQNEFPVLDSAFAYAGPSRLLPSHLFYDGKPYDLISERRMQGLDGERAWGIKSPLREARVKTGPTPSNFDLSESRLIVGDRFHLVDGKLRSTQKLKSSDLRLVREHLRDLRLLLEKLNDPKVNPELKRTLVKEIQIANLQTVFTWEGLLARRSENVETQWGVKKVGEVFRDDLKTLETLLFKMGVLPNAEVLQTKMDSDAFLDKVLASHGVTSHFADRAAFREGFRIGSVRKEYVEKVAWDVDEVLLHWALSFRDLLRGGSHKDARYHNTPEAALQYEAFAYNKEALSPFNRFFVGLLEKLPFRMRNHIQMSPEVMAYQLGLSLGAQKTLIMCTTGPAGKILILMNEHPALRRVYLGKSFYESVTIDEIRQAANIYTRESLVLAMRKALSMLKEGATLDPLTHDYVNQIKAHPKKGAKFKHPAIARLLGKRQFETLVDDSDSTYKMLSENEYLTVFKVPSRRKTWFKGPSVQLNFTSSFVLGRTVDRYLDKMALSYIPDLARRMDGMMPQSEIISETAVTADYPFQRIEIEIPWYRQAREFIGPFAELKYLAKAISKQSH